MSGTVYNVWRFTAARVWRFGTLMAAFAITVAAPSPGSSTVRDVPPVDPSSSPVAPGSLLVAMPGLRDPNFAHTVVFMFGVAEHGYQGLVLNRPTGLQLAEALPEEELPEELDLPLFWGGPVQLDQVFILQRGGEGTEGVSKVWGDIFLVHTTDALKKRDGALAVRAYHGSAGWARGQLEMEIAHRGWAVMRGNADWVFDSDPDTLWNKAIRRLKANTIQAAVPRSAGAN